MALKPGDYVTYRNYAAIVMHVFETTANIQFLAPYPPGISPQMDMILTRLDEVSPEHKALIREWMGAYVTFGIGEPFTSTGIVFRVWKNMRYVSIYETETRSTFVREIANITKN